MKKVKETKKVTKKTVKKFKPAYIVDLTDCEDWFDVRASFIEAKYEYDKNLLTVEDWDFLFSLNTAVELEAFVDSVLSHGGTFVCSRDTDTNEHIIRYIGCSTMRAVIPVRVTENKPTKKPNVFKRFWNWITRKK